MCDWIDFCNLIAIGIEENKARQLAAENDYGVYPKSVHCTDDGVYFLCRGEAGKSLVACGDTSITEMFEGKMHRTGNGFAKECPLSNENCDALRLIFTFMNPVPPVGHGISLAWGTGWASLHRPI